MSRSLDTSPQIPPAAASGNKALWAVVAVLGATVVTMGGYLMRESTRPVASGANTLPALVVSPAPVAAVPAIPNASSVLTEKKSAAVKSTTAANKSVPGPTQAQAPSTAPVAASASVAQAPQIFAPPPPAPKPLCLSCGIVTSVIPIQRDGAGNGAGAIAGGVIGGVLGNQVGGGDGKTLATLLGAIGGGFAGNVVEKKMKKETVYQIEVRMEDGSTRSFEQAAHVSVGSKVVVEGDAMHPTN